MNYSAINIQGNIISSEILEKIRLEDVRHQKAVDFNMHQASSVRDEINLAWNLAISHWKAFKTKRDNLSNSESGTSETRRYWMLPILQVLGYELTSANAEIINGKSYAISHRSTNKDGFPIHVVGVNQSLDKRAESGGTRLSPHALVQEYLNNNEHMFGLVTNGRFIRILRDATRLSRLSYLEFDLEQIMEEGLYVEFALMFRVLHSTRMPQSQDSGSESFLEYYHQESMASGSRIRERLSLAVENSIKDLANGLLKNPANQDLRDIMLNEELSPKEYYLFTLRLVYRILFLLVIEERKLIYPEKRDDELNRKRSIYYNFYSIQRLTKLAEKAIYVDPRKTDLWQSLITTFALFENENIGHHLGISPLGSGIFSSDALGVVSKQLVDNETLLRVLRYLVTFENEQGIRVRVNYADLDVEEFGSVYEGLLDYDPEITQIAGEPMFGFVRGDDRSSSGSHYTPEELVRPLIKHSLDYLIEDKLKEADPEKGLLSLTICDVACGSGHILLSAARRVGFELAKIRSKEDQPTPSVLRVAVRDVIRHCIYGVDLNPLAVELCKVALWLEAHEPGEPLNFLDHHIKCGNAIVGLAHAEELENGISTKAFKELPGDVKEIASSFRKRNEQDLKSSNQLSTVDLEKVDNELIDVQNDFITFSQLSEGNPEQIEIKQQAYKELINSSKWTRLKNLADIQVAQFFIPKTLANKDKLTTHGKYLSYLKQGSKIEDFGASFATSLEKRFFHWFLEFPEVFQKGGFDCILGNPPFLGDRRLKEAYGEEFLEWIRYKFTEGATVDLVVYFFLRINDIIHSNGFQSLISTNTVAQGKAREFGLEKLLANNSTINFVDQNVRWPGKAAVEVSLICLHKGVLNKIKILNGNNVKYISSFLDDQEPLKFPKKLYSNYEKSFQGSLILGTGFILSESEAIKLINANYENKYVIRKFLNGDPLLGNWNQIPVRWVIDFRDMPLRRASIEEWNSLNFVEQDNHQKLGTLVAPDFNDYVAYDFIDCIKIIEEKVKPERTRLKIDSKGNIIENEFQLRYPLPIRWWRFCEIRPKLYGTIKNADKVLVSCRVSYFVNHIFVPNDFVYDVTTNVVARYTYYEFAFLQSSLHEYWSWKYASTMRFAIRYTNGDCIDTFPLLDTLEPDIQKKLENIGEQYHEFRKLLMEKIQLGLTKTYNLFHCNALQVQSINEQDKRIVALQKHLERTPNAISLNEAVQGIIKLRKLHLQMDEAVLEAYGWHTDDPKWGKAIQLQHDFYELDNLPENDRIRYTIHLEARKEVLKRLLRLNHELYAAEVEKGLHSKAKEPRVKTPAIKKAKKIPMEYDYQSDIFERGDLKQVAEDEVEYGIQEKSTGIIELGAIVTLIDNKGKTLILSCGKEKQGAQTIDLRSGLYKAIEGKKEGDYIEFGNGFSIIKILYS
jgi:methylase of polypeptide subunit release factors